MKNFWIWMFALLLPMGFAACSDSDDDGDGGGAGSLITIAEADLEWSFDAEYHYQSINVNSRTAWKATLKESASWLTLVKAEGVGGSEKLGFEVSENASKEARSATIVVTCGKTKIEISVTQAGTTLEEMDPSEVKDLDRYYKPAEFERIDMFRNDAQWSWYRSKQSEHFVVFWEPGFGDDPSKAEPVDGVPMAVDIDDLLEKAEQFYTTNVEVLKMTEVGKGKSYLDDYKMEIYLLHQTEWLATGSGYDNVIGALWVNPSTCQPVGSTIAHEIGHSFQYQVYCDKLYQGGTDDLKSGFRYGFGPKGEGGCAYWEQCAQWQSFQDYPTQQFGYDLDVFKANYHRHFHHEWMRYASYWLQSYWVQLHGVEAYGEIWRESVFPDDAIKTYNNVFNNGDWTKTYAELYDYAARMATFDIDGVREYSDGAQGAFSTKLLKTDKGYQVAYASCPSTTGFNVIPLNLPEGENTVSVTFEGLAAGSALADGDAGQYMENEAVKGTVTTYNPQRMGKEGWRYGFVAMQKDGTRVYGDMNEGAVGESTASFEVPENTERLFLVVLGAPSEYSQCEWNEKELDDDQWPYRVTFSGTDLLGNFAIDESADPTDIELEYDVNCDVDMNTWELGKIDLRGNGGLKQIAQAFVLDPAVLSSNTLSIVVGETANPKEGKVAFGLTQPDGSISYTYTANVGFWIAADGAASPYGDAPVFVEYNKDSFVLTYGHLFGATEKGTTYTVKPTFVYVKDGKEYKATITLNMKF
ncbi:MAG: DUF4859 domain-containing protein [Bacteroidaceae bacterium]|nr:DUF4859 domain-containing protein [Bacteroidaceae bacterium]